MIFSAAARVTPKLFRDPALINETREVETTDPACEVRRLLHARSYQTSLASKLADGRHRGPGPARGSRDQRRRSPGYWVQPSALHRVTECGSVLRAPPKPRPEGAFDGGARVAAVLGDAANRVLLFERKSSRKRSEPASGARESRASGRYGFARRHASMSSRARQVMPQLGPFDKAAKRSNPVRARMRRDPSIPRDARARGRARPGRRARGSCGRQLERAPHDPPRRCRTRVRLTRRRAGKSRDRGGLNPRAADRSDVRNPLARSW